MRQRLTEQYLVLGTVWRNHFNKQLAVEGEITPTVAKLREWMDRPRARGLLREVGNLLILAFAEQTNRSFYLRERPHAPTLENLPGELELRLQALPPEEEWEEARRRAREVFKVERFDSALLTAANVAALAGEVQVKAKAAHDACHGLVKEVRQALARLGVSDPEIDQAPRHRTARAVDALLSGLKGQEATSALQKLAQAKLDTSGSAMGESLARAAASVCALRDAKWDLFHGLDHLDDERLEDAQDLLKGLRQVLEADEYVKDLETHLDAAQTDAIRLLAPRKPIIDVGGNGGGEGSGEKLKVWKSINKGRITLAPQNWDAEVEKLKAMLNDGGVRRLVISWTLEREAGSH